MSSLYHSQSHSLSISLSVSFSLYISLYLYISFYLYIYLSLSISFSPFVTLTLTPFASFCPYLSLSLFSLLYSSRSLLYTKIKKNLVKTDLSAALLLEQCILWFIDIIQAFEYNYIFIHKKVI